MKRIGAPLPGHPCLNNHGPKRDLVKGVANAELTLSVGRAPIFAQPSAPTYLYVAVTLFCFIARNSFRATFAEPAVSHNEPGSLSPTTISLK